MFVFEILLLVSLVFLACSLLALCFNLFLWSAARHYTVIALASLAGICFVLAYFGHLILRIL